MPSVVNTNVLSLNAQRNLSRSDSTLATALQRLSSGLRINSAKDDAAGLAIADRFTTQIRGLNQAVRNANDGISLSQTAESALDELGNNLQRIRELAVQSANATNSASDRAALDQEVQQRIAEINRIASQTSFNGQKVLDGSFGSAQFQVGANVGETINVNLTTGVRADQLGQIATATGTAVTASALTDGGLTIAVGQGSAVAIGASAAGSQVQQTADSAFAKVNAINAAGVSGLTATATNATTGTFSTINNATAASTYNLTVNGVAIYAGADNLAAGASLTAADVAAQINLFSAQTGVSAAVSGTSLTLTASDGRNVVVAETITQGAGATLTGTGIAAAQEGTLRGTITLSAAQNITLGGANADIGFASTSIAVDTTTLSTVSVTSVANANTAIQRADAALTAVSSLRSQLGAIQNRFESTIANLSSVSENLTASRSRIQDADFAAETAALTRAQILQQAGVAVLAQANAAPQTVLGLFR
ncbi:MAG: flagellin [Gammaproteobacteria bacterium]|nr:flagellin [Gammaproteobacteria bacterium]